MAIARVYHGATSRAGSPGPIFEDVLGELRRVAPQQERLIELLNYLTGI